MADRGATCSLGMAVCLIAISWCASPPLAADTTVEVCFNHGCTSRTPVLLSAQRLAEIGVLLGGANDAEGERRAIATAVGLFERIAGEQTPIHHDRGGNLADAGVEGRADCIDNSLNTTNWLRVMAGEGWLRHHEVGDRERRWRFIFEHWTAVLIEKESGRRYAVDSWYRDNGQPAWIVPLDEWRRGARPD